MAESAESYSLVTTDEVFSFVKRCMVAAGVEEGHAVDLATLLLAADTRGHFSHGINRLGTSCTRYTRILGILDSVNVKQNF